MRESKAAVRDRAIRREAQVGRVRHPVPVADECDRDVNRRELRRVALGRGQARSTWAWACLRSGNGWFSIQFTKHSLDI